MRKNRIFSEIFSLLFLHRNILTRWVIYCNWFVTLSCVRSLKVWCVKSGRQSWKIEIGEPTNDFFYLYLFLLFFFQLSTLLTHCKKHQFDNRNLEYSSRFVMNLQISCSWKIQWVNLPFFKKRGYFQIRTTPTSILFSFSLLSGLNFVIFDMGFWHF